jgi:hypothetical protein
MANIKAIDILRHLVKQEKQVASTESHGVIFYDIPAHQYWSHNDYRINQVQRILDEDNNVIML